MLSQAETSQYVAASLRQSGHSSAIFSDDAIITLYKQAKARPGTLPAVIDSAVSLAARAQAAQVMAEHVEKAGSLNGATPKFCGGAAARSDAFGRWPLSAPWRGPRWSSRKLKFATWAIGALAVGLSVGLVIIRLDFDEIPLATNEAQVAPLIVNTDSARPPELDQAGAAPAQTTFAMDAHGDAPAEVLRDPPAAAEYSSTEPQISSPPALALNHQTPTEVPESPNKAPPLVGSVPKVSPGPSAGSSLLLLARAGDTMPSLYAKVYRGVKPPPYATVQAMNEPQFRAGAIVVFPAPPGGWPPSGQ